MKDARIYRQRTSDIPAQREAEAAARLYWTAPTPFNPDAAVAGQALAAFVNEGRWVVCCPDCNGAQLAALTDPRFMCVNCGNTKNRGRWRPVAFPAELPAIVAALDVRRKPREQNWLPDETVADLIAENTTLDIDDGEQEGRR